MFKVHKKFTFIRKNKRSQIMLASILIISLQKFKKNKNLKIEINQLEIVIINRTMTTFG